MNNPLLNYLRSYRQKAGLTQDELAFLLGGTHGSTITRHEEYHRVPSLPTALRYAAVYREDPRTLFAGRYYDAHKLVRERAEELLQTTKEGSSSSRARFLHALSYESDSYLVPCDGNEC